MTGIFIVASLLAGGCAYLVGFAITAPRGSFMRSPTGGLLIAGCVLMALFMPPTVASFAAQGEGPGAGLYVLWIALVIGGVLAGMRVWRLATPGASLFAIDDSPVGRAASQLMVASSLDEALEILKREKVVQRDLPGLAEPLRHVGSYYFFQLPQTDAEVYELLADYVPQPLVTEVADRILEGAARKG